MCLTIVTQVLAGKETQIYGGWKVFDMCGGGLSLECQAHKGEDIVPTNRWLTRARFLRNKGKEPRYSLGFHIFEKREDAAQWVGDDLDQRIRSVRYRGVFARGWQAESRVVVARSLYVPARKKRAGR